jgi:8-oxo-dGTP pyrophosphatase MutT (NUDIX family)
VGQREGKKIAVNLLHRIASDVQLMFRRPARIQYAALCYRQRRKRGTVEVLLITSRDTGRWVIPKGWPMTGRRPHAVAMREAFEEAGVRGKARKDSIGHYMYQKGIAPGLKVDCKVQVYALEVDGLCKNFPEKGERDLEWVSFTEAARRVQEPGLKDLLLAFEKTFPPAKAELDPK